MPKYKSIEFRFCWNKGCCK